ncbi:metallophosphoesterase family protein [Chloroflexus sp.]|uniref:metallophosphoesterase family protein n=1 Tax=Chloroflexus sp. TaxID=1904827 RepID=UPI0026122EEC|nr:metallophosphoesterase family protein [uncultured Chloroflexus sp.]
MRIVILSDIHSNIVALETVLTDAGSFDALWCLGDTIGYGPAPNECIELMRQHATVALTGNHDLACLGKISLNDFNPDARRANLWNGAQLTPANREWMLPLQPAQTVDQHYHLAHGSPREPIWEYLLMPSQALANLDWFSEPICFIGHSHVQFAFRCSEERCERIMPEPDTRLALSDGARYFINPGSVGQPRDHDPRAAYAILDTDTQTLTFKRVTYDVKRTQEQMRSFGLPSALIYRLSVGM